MIYCLVDRRVYVNKLYKYLINMLASSNTNVDIVASITKYDTVK